MAIITSSGPSNVLLHRAILERLEAMVADSSEQTIEQIPDLIEAIKEITS
jgi:hypothetical protein